MAKASLRRLGILIDDRTIRIVDMSSFSGKATLHAAISAVAPAADENTMAETLKKALAELKSPTNQACFVVSDRGILFELVSLPQLKPADRIKVIERNAIRMTHAGPEGTKSIQYGFRKTRDVQKPEGTQEEFLIQGTAKTTVQKYLTLAERCDLEIESLVSLPEAMFAALKNQAPKEATEAPLIVDFENSFTHVMMFSANSWLYARDLAKPIDVGRALTDDELKLGSIAPPPESEVLVFSDEKPEKPSATPASEESDEALPLPPLLLGEIKRTILFVEKEFSVKTSQAIFSGLLRPQPELLTEVEKHIKRPTIWAQDSRLDYTPFPSAYTASIGAVFASDDPNSLNLLPAELRPKKGLSTKRTLIFVASVVALFGVGAWSAYIWLQIPQYRSQIEVAKPLAKRALEEKAKPKEDMSEMVVINEHLENLNLLKKNQSPVLFVLKEISRNIPPAMALTELKMFRHGERWVFHCQGRVKSTNSSLEEVPSFRQFLEALQKSPLFDSVGYTPFGVKAPDKESPDSGNSKKAQFTLVGSLRGIGP